MFRSSEVKSIEQSNQLIPLSPLAHLEDQMNVNVLPMNSKKMILSKEDKSSMCLSQDVKDIMELSFFPFTNMEDSSNDNSLDEEDIELSVNEHISKLTKSTQFIHPKPMLSDFDFIEETNTSNSPKEEYTLYDHLHIQSTQTLDYEKIPIVTNTNTNTTSNSNSNSKSKKSKKLLRKSKTTTNKKQIKKVKEQDESNDFIELINRAKEKLALDNSNVSNSFINKYNRSTKLGYSGISLNQFDQQVVEKLGSIPSLPPLIEEKKLMKDIFTKTKQTNDVKDINKNEMDVLNKYYLSFLNNDVDMSESIPNELVEEEKELTSEWQTIIQRMTNVNPEIKQESFDNLDGISNDDERKKSSDINSITKSLLSEWAMEDCQSLF